MQITLVNNSNVRRWISRAFIVSILVYLVVIGYLVAESVMGASRWAPYGVNMPLFIALVIGSEIVVTLTAVWIFRDDAGIWPPTVAEGWAMLRAGALWKGLRTLLAGAWDVPLIDLRLRTPAAILMGRTNRVAALVPLAYALVASAGGAPWGLRGSALLDVGLTLAVWAFMELVMVSRAPAPVPAAAAVAVAPASRGGGFAVVPGRNGARTNGRQKESIYAIRRLEAGDLERVLEIERLKWKGQGATEEMIRSRLETFPEGQLAAIHISMVDGAPAQRTLVAWFTGMLARESQVRALTSWDELTSNGTIRGSDRKGDVIVGVNLTSVTEGATYLLVGEMLATVVDWSKSKFVGGSRLNGFAAFNEHRRLEGKRPFSADEYVRLREIRGYRINEKRIDAKHELLSDAEYVSFVTNLRIEHGERLLAEDELPDFVCSNVRGYMSLPGARMLGVAPDYFEDESSANYGVILYWPNPLPNLARRVPLLKTWVANRIRREMRAEWERRKQRVRDLARRRAEERLPEYLRRGAAGVDAGGEESAVPAEGAGRRR